MSIELTPQYLRNNWIQNKINNKKNNQKSNPESNQENEKECFFQKNLKFINDFKKELMHKSIDHNLYQLIVDVCTYVNNKKNYSYNYIIYDINSFFDLYNKNLSSIDNDYLLKFIDNIKNNFCLNKELIDKINYVISTFNDNDLNNNEININEINITSPDFEEEGFEFTNCYFKNNTEFIDNLEIEDIEYNNCYSDNEY